MLHHYGKRAPQIATQLAIHFEQGRDFPRAVEYLTHAGDHAAKLYGYAEAERHYTRALNLAQKLPEEAQPKHLSKLYHKRGTVNHAMGDFTQAAKDFANMLEQARVLDSLELQSTALNALTMSLFFSHRLDETVARATEALEVAERAGSAKLRVETMFLIGLKHCCYGELKEATGLLDEVVATSRQLNHKPGLLSGLTWRACLHFFQSEYDAAITMTKEALQLASELRDGFLMLCSMFFLGLSQGNQGKMSAALETLNEALKKAQRNGDLFWHPRFPNCIGWIYRELHDFESARKYNEEGIEVARRYHVMEAEANSLINRGIDHIRDGEHEQTAVTFHEVRDIFERDAWFRWRYNIRLEAAMAEHWLRQGDLEKAREFAERLMAAATEHEVHKYIAVAHNLMARASMKAGDLEAAEKHFDAAVAELDDYPAPLVEWRVHAGRARLKSKMGDEAGAVDAAARASEIINLIAGNVKDEKLRNTFLSATAGKLKPNH